MKHKLILILLTAILLAIACELEPRTPTVSPVPTARVEVSP